MTSHTTLKEYLQMKNLERRNEFFLLSEAKQIPVAITLDKDKKIDGLIIQILEYVKKLIGLGPLYNKFQVMMEHLHKTFTRELSEFHKVTVYNKLQNDHHYLEQVKKANQKLNQYVSQCQKQRDQAEGKLKKLVYLNKDIKKFQKKAEQKVIIDNFDDDQVVQTVTKVQAVGKISFNDGNNKKELQKGANIKVEKKWQIKI